MAYSGADMCLTNIVNTATSLCIDVARLENEESINDTSVKIVVIYTDVYLCEHREEADPKELTFTVRTILSGIRRDHNRWFQDNLPGLKI